MLLNSGCQYSFEDFHINVHKNISLQFSFLRMSLPGIDIRGMLGSYKELEYSLLFNFLEKFEKNHYQFFFKWWQNSPAKKSNPGFSFVGKFQLLIKLLMVIFQRCVLLCHPVYSAVVATITAYCSIKLLGSRDSFASAF